jgi:hypothetical protein
MKYVVLLLSLMLIACGAEETTVLNEPAQRDVESKKNAVPNYKDGQGLKQGYWVIYGKDDPASGYPDQGKIEEGNYNNDLKHGEWRFYKRNGKDVDSIAEYDLGVWIKNVSRDSVVIKVE